MARKAKLSHAAGYRMHKAAVRLEVRRDLAMNSRTPRFAACAYIQGKDWRRVGSNYTCAYGRNPRIAIANVLRREALLIVGRRGTFAGYRRKGRR